MDYRTGSVCKMACKLNGLSLQWCPEEYKQDEELNYIAVQQNGKAWDFMPDHLKDFEVSEIPES